MSSYVSIDSHCSTKCCLYKSESERPSIQQIITEGTKVDRLYLGKFLPLREKKLLTKLIKTRAIYNDVVDELLSHSDFSIASKSQNNYCSCCSLEVDYTGRTIRKHGDDASKMIHEALKRRRLERARKDSSAPCKCDYSGCESLMRLMSKSCVKDIKHSAGHIRRTVDTRARRSLKQLRKKIRETTSDTRKQMKHTNKNHQQSSTSSTSRTHVKQQTGDVKIGKNKVQRGHKAFDYSKQKIDVKMGANEKAPQLSTSKSVALPDTGSKTITRSASADFEKKRPGKKKRLSHTKKDRRYPDRCFCTLGLKSKLDKQMSSKESRASYVRSPEKPPSSSRSLEIKQKQLVKKGQVGERHQKTKSTKQQEIKSPKTSKSSTTKEHKKDSISKQVETLKQVKQQRQTQAGGGVLARCMCTLKLKAKATKEATKELFSKGSMTSQHSNERKLRDEKISTIDEKTRDVRAKHTQESGRALKRCFCTLKLKAKATKNLLSKGSITSFVDSQTPKPRIQNRGIAAKKKDKKNKGEIALAPKSCDSICIPYECQPEECLKIIKKKQGAHIERIPKAANIEIRKTKNIGNLVTDRRSREKRIQSKVLSKTHESGDVIIKKQKSSSISTGTSKERRRSQGDIKSGSSVHVQAEKDIKHIKVGSALKRCFCTLKLNTNEKMDKKHPNIFSRGTETPPNDNVASKTNRPKNKYKPKSFKTPKVRRVETGTIPDRPRRMAVSSMTGHGKMKHRRHKRSESSRTKSFTEPDNEFDKKETQESCPRKVVRISSSFSFGIEFSRETSDVGYCDKDKFGRVIEPSSSLSIPIPKRCLCTLDFHKQPKIYTVSRVSVQQTLWTQRFKDKSLTVNNSKFEFNVKHDNSFTNYASKLIKTLYSDTQQNILENYKSKDNHSLSKLEEKSFNLIHEHNKEYFKSYEDFEPSRLHEDLNINQARPKGPFGNQIFYALNVQNTQLEKKAPHKKDKSKRLVTVTSSFSLDLAFTQGKSLRPIISEPEKDKGRPSILAKLMQKSKLKNAVKCMCSLNTPKCMCSLLTKKQEIQAKKDADAKVANLKKQEKKSTKSKAIKKEYKSNTKIKDTSQGTNTDRIKKGKSKKTKSTKGQGTDQNKTKTGEPVAKEQDHALVRSSKSSIKIRMPQKEQQKNISLKPITKEIISFNREAKNKTYTKSAVEREAVQIESSFGFCVEFTRNQIHDGADIQSAAEILKRKRISSGRDNKKQPGIDQAVGTKPKQRYVKSQVDRRIIKNQSVCTKSFDTVKLQKQGHVPAEEVKIVKHKGVGHNLPKKADLHTKSISTKIKSTDECPPGICIPGKCYPPDCYKLIHGKLHRDVGTVPKKISKHLRSEASMTIMKHAQQGTKKPYSSHRPTAPGHKERMIVEEPRFKRQAVRIGSHFNVNVEFFKDYEEQQQKTLKPGINLKKSGNSPDTQVRRNGLETQTTSSRKGISPLLKKCFCTKNKDVPVYAITNVTRPAVFTNRLQDAKTFANYNDKRYTNRTRIREKSSLLNSVREKTSNNKRSVNRIRVRNIDSRVLMDKLRSTLVKVPFVKRCFSTIPLHFNKSENSRKNCFEGKMFPASKNGQENRDKTDKQCKETYLKYTRSSRPLKKRESVLEIMRETCPSRRIKPRKVKNLNYPVCQPVYKESYGKSTLNNYSLQHLTSVPEHNFHVSSEGRVKRRHSNLTSHPQYHQSQRSIMIQMGQIRSNKKRRIDKGKRKYSVSVSDAKIETKSKTSNLGVNQFEYNYKYPSKCCSYEISNRRSRKLPTKSSRTKRKEDNITTLNHHKLNIEGSLPHVTKNKKATKPYLRPKNRPSYGADNRGPFGDTRFEASKTGTKIENSKSFRRKSDKIKYVDKNNERDRNSYITKPQNNLNESGIGHFFQRVLCFFALKNSNKTGTKTDNGIRSNGNAQRKRHNLMSSKCDPYVHISLSQPRNEYTKQPTQKYQSRSTHVTEVASTKYRQTPVYRSKRTLYKDRGRQDVSNQEIIRKFNPPEIYKARHGVIFKSSTNFLNTDRFFKQQNDNLYNQKRINKNHPAKKTDYDRRRPKIPEVQSLKGTETNYFRKFLKNIADKFRQTKKEAPAKVRKLTPESQRHINNNHKSYRRDFIVARAAVGEQMLPHKLYTMHNKTRLKKNTNKRYLQPSTSHTKHRDRKIGKYSTINRSEEIKTIYPYVPKNINADLGKSRKRYALKRYKSEHKPQKRTYYTSDDKPFLRKLKPDKKHVKNDSTRVNNKYSKSNTRNIIQIMWNAFNFNKSHLRKHDVITHASRKQTYKHKKYIDHNDLMNKAKPRYKDIHARKREMKNSMKHHKRLTCLYLQAEYDRDHGKLNNPHSLKPAAASALEPRCCCNKKKTPCPPESAGAKVQPCHKIKSPSTNEAFKDLMEPSQKQKRLSLTPHKTLPPGTTLPPYDAGSQKPLFEMRLKAGTLDLVNSDEVYGQISKLNKLSANRARDYLRQLKKLHGEGCCCCICKAVKEKVNAEDTNEAEIRKKECIERKKKERDLKAKDITEWLMELRRKPCVCGIKKCIREKDIMTELEILRYRGLLTKPCVCGTKICAAEWAKKLASMKGVEAKDVEKRIHEIKKQAVREKKLAEYHKRLKVYKKEDKALRAKQKKLDSEQMKHAKKAAVYGDCSIIADSVADIGKTGFMNIFHFIGCFFSKLFHPVKEAKSFAYRVSDPGPRIKTEAQNIWIKTGLPGTASRTCYRLGSLSCPRKIKSKLESSALGAYLVNRDPRKRHEILKKLETKKRLQSSKREPQDFQCSLFMASLRKRPFLKIYFTCPWFYPHCISLLGILRTLMEAILFCLAMIVWSPCILLLELCRAMMCCTMCTG